MFKNVLLTVLFITLPVFANPPVPYPWDPGLTFHENVKIRGFSVWKENAPIYVSFDNNFKCYIQETEKNLYSLALAVMSTGKPVNILCVKSDTLSYGGFDGERLSQIWF